MSLPPEVRVHATNERALYRLPWRRLVGPETPGGALGCLAVLALFSLLTLGFYLSLLIGSFEKNVGSGLLSALFGFPLAALGFFSLFLTLWLAVGGRSEILLTRGRLLLRERAGPLVYRRSLDPSKILRFRAHPMEAGKASLDFDFHNGARGRWAVDYPAPLIEALAAELSRRKDEMLQAAPAGPGELELVDGLLRLTIRPGAARAWLFPLAVAGIGLYTWLVAFFFQVARQDAPDHLKAIGGLLAFLWGVGLMIGLYVAASARRTVVVEVSEGRFKATTIDILGRRVREWPRKDVWGFEVEKGTLGLRLSNGSRPTLVAGRDAADLEWIAGILRRAPGKKKDVEVLATTSPKGTCQVCATAMEERVVWCRRCRTPHHLECWVYTGMCSTFGCREIGYVEA